MHYVKGTAAERRAARHARLETVTPEEAARLALRMVPRTPDPEPNSFGVDSIRWGRQVNVMDLDDMQQDLRNAIEDARGDFPEVTVDDIAHDMAQSVMRAWHSRTSPATIREFSRGEGVDVPW